MSVGQINSPGLGSLTGTIDEVDNDGTAHTQQNLVANYWDHSDGPRNDEHEFAVRNPGEYHLLHCLAVKFPGNLWRQWRNDSSVHLVLRSLETSAGEFGKMGEQEPSILRLLLAFFLFYQFQRS